MELGYDPKTRMNPQLFENSLRNDARDFESPSSAIPTHRLMLRTLYIILDSLLKIK